MKTSSTIRREALAALRSNRGWGVAVGAWAVWFGIELVANQVLGGLLFVFPLILLIFYYLHFAKEYGVTALSIAAIRGEPRFQCAFMGVGNGWRTVGIHFRIGWRLLAAASLWLVPVLAISVWIRVDAEAAKEILAAQVLPVAKSHTAVVCGLALVLCSAAFLPMARTWYHYRLAYNVLVDHSDWTGEQVVEESRRLMRGRRMTMFLLDLWFLALLLGSAAPGLWLVIQGGFALSDRPDILQTLLRVGGDGLSTALLDGDALRPLADIALGMMCLLASSLFNTLYLQPYWTTARAMFYENVLDLDESVNAVTPEDGDFRNGGADAI